MVLVFPAVVAAVSLVFAVQLYKQYQERRRAHQLLWTLSMVQAFVASVAYILTVALNGHPLFFKIYYIFGALMVAAYLGLGSVYLVASPAVARACAAGVVLFTVLGAAGIIMAPVNVSELVSLNGGAGKGVLENKGLWLGQLIVMNLFGTFGVVIPALVSALRLSRRQAAPGFARGNILIALGVLVIGGAGSAARLGAGGFWLTMALGYVIAYAGFRTITAAERSSPGATVS